MRLARILLLTAGVVAAQPRHGQRPAKLLIKGAMVVEGIGTPASGPRDILIEGNRIVQVGRIPSPPADAAVIDGTGKYVLPGLINMHGHMHQERAGKPMDVNYVLKLWLACGITAVRDVGSDFEKSKTLRAQSAAGEIAAPRMFLYPFFSGANTPDDARRRILAMKQGGADGVKFLGVHRDIFQAAALEIMAQGLGRAHHIGVEETNAWDDIANSPGTAYYTIEHWYGIPDAALADGVQKFPPSYNYQNEVDRFRYAGRLWREADPARLEKVLEAMAKAHIAWDPTLNIYEASRDVSRAQNQPWFKEYLHPALAKFFEPSLESHGSYFFNWSTEDEVYWKENYRIWMKAVRDFERLGGIVTTGEDAGYIYQMYGVGLLRELELHQEAGFHPLQVMKHATYNGALVLGKENEIGRVRAGWLADLIVVNGNPLANFKILYPVGTDAGKLEWTIKDGIPYHAPALLAEVKRLAAAAIR